MTEAQLKNLRMKEYYKRRVKADFAPKQKGDGLDDSETCESPSPTGGDGDDSPLSPEALEQRVAEKQEREE